MKPAPRPTAQPNHQTHFIAYGMWHRRMQAAPAGSAGPDLIQQVALERKILGNYEWCRSKGYQLMPWTEHFKKFISLIWDHPQSSCRFTWNPNAERILEKISEMSAESAKMYLAVAGHASSGKTRFFAVYAIAMFLIGETHPDKPNKLADPDNVKVFVTSTTLEEARKRIWGDIEAYWRDACLFFGGEKHMMAKLVSSMGKIVRITPEGKQNELAGISLIPGGKGHDGDVDTKIGFKNRKIVFIGDELPLLTHKLLKSALGNLASNPTLQFIGTGNPTSPFDPFGDLMEPKDGWQSIDESSAGWETKYGYCIRFDGELSANVLAGREIYPGLLTLETLLKYRAQYGDGYAKNAEYYRMVRGFLAPGGDTLAIYTPAEITGTGSMMKAGTGWVGNVVWVGFLDPAFSHGGDEADACFCKVGDFSNQLYGKTTKIIELVEIENLMLKVKADDKGEDRNQQLVDLFHAACEKRGIKVEDRGVDSTGAGDPFSTIMATKMGRGFQMVSFAGAASDKRVSPTDSRLGTERFANRVSELWYVGKELMRAGQIRGLDHATCNQMIARLYKLVDRERVEVEPKKKMKERTNGKSPDRADSFFGCVEIARTRHGLSSAARAAPGKSAKRSTGNREWDALVGAMQRKRATHSDLAPPSFGGGGVTWGDYN